MKQLKLYNHWMSSCSRRVRIALSLKGLEYENIIINPINDPEFLKLNPMGLIPVLVDEDVIVSDSFAILLYLEEKYHEHPLLPHDLQKKALNYQSEDELGRAYHGAYIYCTLFVENIFCLFCTPEVASIVSSSIQPYQNQSVVNYIGELVNPDEKLPWAQLHIRKGFIALEKLLTDYAGKYATGDEVFLADLFLAPQLDNASIKFKVDMAEFPILSRLQEAYKEIPAFST